MKTIDSLIASAEDFTNFTGNDIFICEYSLITKVDTSFLSKFRSVVVDCRYPSGFSASRTKDVTSGKSSLDAARASFVVPDELSSDEWWSKLVFNTNVGKTNRLLIDSFPAENIVPYLSFLSKRQFMELLALRTAFLMGKNTFVSPFSIGKTILSWARHRIKQTDSSGQSKFQLVKTFLISLIIPCYCSLGSKSFLNGDDLSTSASISCEVHKCRMTASQQSQYDRVCRQLNSILSGGLRAKKVDDFNGIADAFVSIRRICTHADIISALRDLKIQPDTLSENERPPSFGPELRCFQTSRAYESQPDALLARRLLSESSKFSHLLTLLRYESAGSVVGDFSPSTRTELSSELHTPKHAQISKKIVILAVLPEIQFLASVLLGSVGIEHELLLTTRSSTSFHASSSIDWSCEEIREWNRSQSKLSKFNSDAVGGRSAVNVVIAAPITVAGDHCGLGVEEADVIVLLDEDWSGRGELFTRSLLSRCKCRKELHGGGKLRFIRLVAEDSCEAFFLSPRQETCEHSALVDNTYKESFWQTSAFGAFISPMKNKGYYNKTSAGRLEDFTFCFPGRHLLLTRNIRLSNILCVTNTQPLLQSSTEDRFLSVAEGDDHVLVEMTMLQRLIEGEEVIGDFMYRIGPFAASFTLRPAMPPLTSKKTFCQLTQQRELDRSQLRRISRNSNSRDMELLTTGSLSLPKNALRFVTGPPNTMIMDYSECDALVSTMSPTERAFSVLFYDHEAKPKAFQADAQLHQPRVNIFSGLFSSSDRGAAHDGSQGSEALVYFPPVFPRMQECASLAKKDTETIWPPFLDKKSGLDTVQHVDSSRGLSGVPDSERLVTEDEASYSDAASVLLDSFDDYGLAGIGAVPFLRESVIYAGNASRRVTTNQIVTADSTSEWISSTPVSDLEEFHIPWKVEQTGCNPCSVVVYVTRKRQRGSSAQAGRSAATLLNGTSIPVTNANIYRDHNGLHKKGKKPVLGSSFNRLPTTDSLQQAQYSTHRKDDYRHRLLSSLRQSGTGTTIFESPAFQAAAVRLRNKVSKRIFQSSWTSGSAFDTGSGLPLVASKQHNVFSSNEGRNTFDDGSPLWTSVIKRLQSKDATTGREAIELSTAQQLALKQSRSAPCRVDFGPFQCGFLSCPSGMIFSVQPKQRVGVSLPMGVKIVSSSFDQDLLKWTADEDIMLITAVKRFGMNWILVARLLSGCHDISVSSLIESKSQLPMRATRSCRDRWQRIASSNSRLVGGMPLTEHYHETTNSRLARAVDSKAIFLVPTTGSTTNSDDSSVNVTNLDTTTDPVNTPVTDGPTIPDKRKKRRGFTAFQVAQAMKYSVPLSIPGVAAGSPPDSHPSHDQAVQTSISAAWTGRPTDMWPLQLLDAADKHRAKTKAAMDSSIAANPIRQTMSSSSSRNLTSNGVAHSISRSQPVASVPHSHRPSSSVSIVQSTSLRSQKQMNRSLSQSNGRSASTVAGGSPPLVPPSVPPTLPSVFPANSVPVSVDAISSSSRQSFVPPPSAFPVAPTSTATSTGAAVTPKSVVPIGIPATNVVSAETTTNTSSGNVNNTPITPAIKPVLVSSVAPADKPIVVAPVAPAVKPALLAPVAPAVKPILIVPVAPAVKPVQGAAAVVAEPIVESRPENPPVVVSRIEDDVVRPEQPQAKT